MSTLGLARMRQLKARLGVLDKRLSDLVAAMAAETSRPTETLHAPLANSGELENIVVRSSFRFGATGAHEQLVNERNAALHELRFKGRQTFRDFMMHTVKSTETRLQAMSDRAIRAGDLPRTWIDVERSAQNQAMLTSMDRRADLQLRLNRAVEGRRDGCRHACELAGRMAVDPPYPQAHHVGWAICSSAVDGQIAHPLAPDPRVGRVAQAVADAIHARHRQRYCEVGQRFPFRERCPSSNTV